MQPGYLQVEPDHSDIEAQGSPEPAKNAWSDNTCTCLPGSVQLLVFVMTLLTALMFITQFVEPRPHEFQVTACDGDAIIAPEEPVPVDNRWAGILSDFWRRPSKVLLPVFRKKGFLKRWWLVLLPFVWFLYVLFGCCTRCCRCCRCMNCLWRPKRRHWYLVLIVWMAPIIGLRLEYTFSHSNEEYFHPDGNVLIIGDSWSVPGKDFMFHSKYKDGYILWPHKVAQTLKTKVRGPNLTAVGYRAEDWVAEISRFKIQAKKNDLVIIHLGGNDSRGTVPQILWLLLRTGFKKLFSSMGCCETVDYDAEIVRIMKDHCKLYIEYMDQIVVHMKKLGFTRFLVSEPPFHKNVPMIGKFNTWGLLDHNNVDAIKENLQKSLQGLQKKYPENIRIFEEIKHLDEIGVAPEAEEDRYYIDPVHAGQPVHDKLTLKAAAQVKKNGWNNWKEL